MPLLWELHLVDEDLHLEVDVGHIVFLLWLLQEVQFLLRQRRLVKLLGSGEVDLPHGDLPQAI